MICDTDGLQISLHDGTECSDYSTAAAEECNYQK